MSLVGIIIVDVLPLNVNRLESRRAAHSEAPDHGCDTCARRAVASLVVFGRIRQVHPQGERLHIRQQLTHRAHFRDQVAALDRILANDYFPRPLKGDSKSGPVPAPRPVGHVPVAQRVEDHLHLEERHRPVVVLVTEFQLQGMISGLLGRFPRDEAYLTEIEVVAA